MLLQGPREQGTDRQATSADMQGPLDELHAHDMTHPCQTVTHQQTILGARVKEMHADREGHVGCTGRQ